MPRTDRELYVEWTAAAYLGAVEAEDLDELARLWAMADRDPELDAAFLDVLAGLRAGY